MNKGEAFWDRLSKSAKPETKPDQTSIMTIEATKMHLHPNDLVLDIGCGSGAITAEIAKHAGAVHAIDISAGMIEAAKAKAVRSKAENITFEKATIFDDRLNDQAFDVILAFNVLHHLDDTKRVILRTHELLKPGGIFISATACMNERITLMSLFLRLLTKTGLVPDMRFFKVKALETEIEKGGFKIKETKELTGLPEYFLVAVKESDNSTKRGK